MLLVIAVIAAGALSGAVLAGCGGDSGQADKLAAEADSLRVSAVEKFRKSIAAIDGLMRGAAAGQALPANQTKAIADKAVDDLNGALAELTIRDGKLAEAGALDPGGPRQEYVDMLRQSNDRLSQSIGMTLEIGALLGKEQYSLAGWDEIKTQTIVSQVYSMQQQIEQAYGESESLRNRAEKLRIDLADDF